MNATDPKDTAHLLSNESQPMSTYARGAEWNRKGFFWLPFGVAFDIAAIVVGVLNLATPGTQWGLVAVQWVALPIGLGALARMIVCFRRARRIWAGAQ